MKRLLPLLGVFLSGVSNAETLNTFERTTLDSSPKKPAFIKISDLDGNGQPEIIVSMFGNSPVGSGSVYIYTVEEGGQWKKEKLTDSDAKFPNSLTVSDVNGDGLQDIIVPGGFLACTRFPFGYCGSMQWFEQKADGSFEKRLIVSKSKRFYHHVELVDFDYDGLLDLVAVGEEKGTNDDGSSELQYFKGTAGELKFEQKPRFVSEGLGSFPTVLDLDNDGRWEVYSSEYFGSKGSFSWIRENQEGQWERNYIDSSVGKTIQLSFVSDLFGKGELWAIGANHTNTKDNKNASESAVYAYKVPDFMSSEFNPESSWEKIKISEGVVSKKSPFTGPLGAPGVFSVGDVDGDGDKDIVVSGDGDPRIILLKQIAVGKFETLTLDTDMPQGGVAVYDLDGDGIDEIVASSYEKNKLYIYNHK